MKNWKLAAGICLVLCVLSLVIIWQVALWEQNQDVSDENASNGTRTEDVTQTETETEEADERLFVIEEFPKELQEQLLCIVDNKAVWVKGAGQEPDEEQREVVKKDIWYYMVSDLDQNGQLEIICSLIDSEEENSTSYFYEVNENATALIPLYYDEDDIEDESQPDIIENTTEVYCDAENGIFYYIEEDVVRKGASDSYIAKSAISIQDGCVRNRILMYAKDAPNYMGTYTIYTDSYGNRIRESKYSDAGRYFEGCEQKRATFSWFIIVNELADNPTEAASQAVMEEDISLLELLRASYEGFGME